MAPGGLERRGCGGWRPAAVARSPRSRAAATRADGGPAGDRAASSSARLRRHRARHPAHPDPRRHRAPHRRLGPAARAEPGHGPGRRQRQGEVRADRDAKFTDAFDAVLNDAGLEVVKSGVRMPRMNSIMERWIQACRREFLDRTLIWNQRHLLHALREYETFYNRHRPHRALGQAAPLRPLPGPITEPGQITRMEIHRQDRLGGTPPRVPTCRLTRPDE